MLIAEIGNCHFGSIDKAKELIKAAKESGADIVKSQAFIGDDIVGSMLKQFYKTCQFTTQQYIDLIYYARDIGTDLFYSIFSPTHWTIEWHQNYFKIAGNQMKQRYFEMKLFDSPNTIFSISQGVDLKRVYKVKRAEPLYVGEYLKPAQFHYIKTIEKYFNKPVGYSDHTEGIDACVMAHDEYECDIIEKHFTLEKNVTYNGQVYRDTVHGALPNEFELLARRMK